METHLLNSNDYMSGMFPVEGVIKTVIPRDDQENPTEAITLYMVDLYRRNPTSTDSAGPMRAAWQEYGGLNDRTNPLSVGDQVVVSFLEGDANRPYISGLIGSLDNEIAVESSEFPKSIKKTRGHIETTDKDGNHTITLADERNYTITDESGDVIIKLAFSGGSYEVQLGGDSGLKELVTEAFKSTYNGHKHTAAGSLTTVPDLLMTSSDLTSITKAK